MLEKIYQIQKIINGNPIIFNRKSIKNIYGIPWLIHSYTNIDYNINKIIHSYNGFINQEILIDYLNQSKNFLIDKIENGFEEIYCTKQIKLSDLNDSEIFMIKLSNFIYALNGSKDHSTIQRLIKSFKNYKEVMTYLENIKYEIKTNELYIDTIFDVSELLNKINYFISNSKVLYNQKYLKYLMLDVEYWGGTLSLISSYTSTSLNKYIKNENNVCEEFLDNFNKNDFFKVIINSSRIFYEISYIYYIFNKNLVIEKLYNDFTEIENLFNDLKNLCQEYYLKYSNILKTWLNKLIRSKNEDLYIVFDRSNHASDSSNSKVLLYAIIENIVKDELKVISPEEITKKYGLTQNNITKILIKI